MVLMVSGYYFSVWFICCSCGRNTFGRSPYHSVLVTKVWYISSELPIFPNYGYMDFGDAARGNL